MNAESAELTLVWIHQNVIQQLRPQCACRSRAAASLRMCRVGERASEQVERL